MRYGTPNGREGVITKLNTIGSMYYYMSLQPKPTTGEAIGGHLSSKALVEHTSMGMKDFKMKFYS
jgi:hypothetical protein